MKVAVQSSGRPPACGGHSLCVRSLLTQVCVLHKSEIRIVPRFGAEWRCKAYNRYLCNTHTQGDWPWPRHDQTQEPGPALRMRTTRGLNNYL